MKIRIIEYLHTESFGHQRYVVALAESLRKYADVSIVCSDRGLAIDTHVKTIPVMRAIDLERVGPIRILDRLWAYRSYPRTLKAAVKSELNSSAGFVHFQELPPLAGRQMIAAVHSAGLLSAVTVHNVFPHDASAFSRAADLMRVRAWSAADILLVHSPTLRELLITRGLRADRIAVVPHPVWPVVRTPPQGAPSRDFLFFGQLRSNKGVHLFIDALASLGDPAATIAGQGSEIVVSGIRAHIAQAKLKNCQFIPGFVAESDVARLFAGHAALVAPYTDFAAQSGVTHLALAHGIPIVVTDVGGLGDVVREYGVGRVAKVDVSSLATAMSEVLDRRSFYQDSVNRAVQLLAQDKVAESLVEHLCRCVQRGA